MSKENRRSFILRSLPGGVVAAGSLLYLASRPLAAFANEQPVLVQPGTLETSSLALGFRSVEASLAAVEQKYPGVFDKRLNFPTPLENVLKTYLHESEDIAMVNGHLARPGEISETGPIAFTVNPTLDEVNNGIVRFALFANSNHIVYFRTGEPQDQALLALHDWTVALMKNGRTATARIEIDNDFTPEKFTHLTRMLLYLGVKNIVLGNEFNDPGAQSWRDVKRRVFESALIARKLSKEMNIPVRIGTPGLAYHDNTFEYLRGFIKDMKKFQKDNGINSDLFDSITAHYYGPASEFISWCQRIRDVMKEEGVLHLGLDIGEIGNPADYDYNGETSDKLIAEGYLPQVLALAKAARYADSNSEPIRLINRINWYSFFDNGHEDNSLAFRNGAGLKTKTSFRAYEVMTRLLARVKEAKVAERNNASVVVVEGERWDGIKFQVMWAKATDQQVAVPVGSKVFTVFGEEIKLAGSGSEQIVNLTKRMAIEYDGSAKIVLLPKAA